MSRSDLLARLADLVAARVLTPAEAAQIIAQFDAGLFVPSDLPDPPPSRDDWLIALLAVLLLVRGNTTSRLPAVKRARARTLLRRGFEGDAARLADGVTNGTVSLAAWQTGVQAIIGQYARQMAVAGAGGLPTTATIGAVDAQLADQWRFLRRFAGAVGARAAVARPLSGKLVAARTRQIGGVAAWAAFFMAQGDGAGQNVVEQWISREDGAMCSRCAGFSRQFFLPGAGPMPGLDCLAGGHCRCKRVQVYDPAIYAQLTGQRRLPEGTR